MIMLEGGPNPPTKNACESTDRLFLNEKGPALVGRISLVVDLTNTLFATLNVPPSTWYPNTPIALSVNKESITLKFSVPTLLIPAVEL